jgi:pimeloyl-ACP methyl ester carboxylesterase
VLCGPGIVERLAPADKLSDVSPSALSPSGVPIVLVSGVLDRLTPLWVAYDYARLLRKKHRTAPRLINVADAGHFALVTPPAPAWQAVRGLVEASLKDR